MASFTTDGFNYAKSFDGGTGQDLVPAGATQAAATAIGNVEIVHVLQGAANAGLILASVLNLDASGIVYVVNDGPNTIKVYPAVGEVINALAANAALTVATGEVGVFVRVPKHLGHVHGRTSPATAGWAAASIPAVT